MEGHCSVCCFVKKRKVYQEDHDCIEILSKDNDEFREENLNLKKENEKSKRGRARSLGNPLVRLLRQVRTGIPTNEQKHRGFLQRQHQVGLRLAILVSLLRAEGCAAGRSG